MTPPVPGPPKARRDDTLRVVVAALVAAVFASIRRIVGRGGHEGWSFRLELLIASYRGTWSLMPKIGLVRWRNVGESLSPIRTDGLTPQFTHLGSEPERLQGAWLEPPVTHPGTLLYFHGGGFVFGSIRTHGELIGALARSTRLRTFALDYRLAPEHAAPAAVEDALAAYLSLLSQDIPPKSIVLAGDSAGGTLVLNVLVALRNAGHPLPAAGIALCPWVDLSCSGASFETNAAFDFVGKRHCQLAADSYLQGKDPQDPEVSPLFADLSNLPPLLIQAGGAESLLDQVREFVGRAESAGIEVDFSVYENMIHVWHLFRDATPSGQLAIEEIGDFAQRHCEPGPPTHLAS